MKNETDEKDSNEFLKQLGRKIKTAREQAGLTQEQMDTPPNQIPYKRYQSIESGNANITLKTFYRVCKKLGIKPIELFK